MVQTGTGEVVTQNPAWWQHFGALSDPEAVRREVEAILETSERLQVDKINVSFATEMLGANIFHSSSFQKYQQRGYLNEAELNDRGTPDRGNNDSPPDWLVNPHFPLSPRSEKDDASSSTRCPLGTEPGNCICAWPVQNGQERVWQFVKIPLQETEGKSSRFWILNSGSSALSNDLWLLLAQNVTEQQQLCGAIQPRWSVAVESLETVLGAIATQFLPPSLSMEELLDQIHQVLAFK